MTETCGSCISRRINLEEMQDGGEVHTLPSGGKVEQVRATFSGVHVHLPAVHRPSVDSEEQAMYGLDVSYEMPVPVLCDTCLSHWYGPSTDPPWHDPTLAQFRMCWTARLMSMPLAPRAILTRSPRADTAP